jgi:hypothetical protein
MYLLLWAKTPCLSQVCGRMARRPRALARAQRAASSLIPAIKAVIEGLAPSNMKALRCFYIIQGMSRVADARPFCIGLGVFCRVTRHHSGTEASLSSDWHEKRSHERISFQTCRENGHSRSRWRIVSGAWSHSRHLGGCGNWRRARWSAVQQRSRLASHWKKRTRGGAKHCWFLSKDSSG